MVYDCSELTNIEKFRNSLPLEALIFTNEECLVYYIFSVLHAYRSCGGWPIGKISLLEPQGLGFQLSILTMSRTREPVSAGAKIGEVKDSHLLDTTETGDKHRLCSWVTLLRVKL